jgi:hypothetical protein
MCITSISELCILSHGQGTSVVWRESRTSYDGDLCKVMLI